MEEINEKTIVKLDLKSRWATTLNTFAKEHPFLNVHINLKPTEDDADVDQVRVEFSTYKCSKREANKRFFYFLLIYAEWLQLN